MRNYRTSPPTPRRHRRFFGADGEIDRRTAADTMVSAQGSRIRIDNSKNRVLALHYAVYVQFYAKQNRPKGPSIYDVHTEGKGVGLRWKDVDGGRGSSPMWTSSRPHRKLKLESTD